MRRDVHGLADRRPLRVLAIAQRADDDLADVNANAGKVFLIPSTTS
jgi:hypothetical protein